MKREIYKDKSGVVRLQQFNAESIAATGNDGYLQPGDIPHHLFGGNKYFDPAEVLSWWQDANGITAWLMLDPRHGCYDLQIRPDLRGGDFERELLQIAWDETIAMMRRHKIERKSMYEEVFRADTGRIRLLRELGWECVESPVYIQNRAGLSNIPEPALPDGYSIRSVRGIEEAKAVSDLHAATFNIKWPSDLYEIYMQAPGYEAKNEYVVVAPDSSLAAFTVTWRDELNSTGLFEPVGTHPDHRRLGLGKALMYYGMHRMADDGMKFATVVNEADNEASQRLYRSCGFEPWLSLDGYTKGI